MNYIRITKDNIYKEHICCAMSGRQSVMKKEWMKGRFDDGLVFYRSAASALSNTSLPRTRGCRSRRIDTSTSTACGSPAR